MIAEYKYFAKRQTFLLISGHDLKIFTVLLVQVGKFFAELADTEKESGIFMKATICLVQFLAICFLSFLLT